MHDLLYQPLLTLSEDRRNAILDAFDKVLLRVDFQRSLSALGAIALTELAQTLADRRIRKLTLIPFDRLGLFPLPSTPVIIDGVQERLGERYEVTIAPNARAAEIAHRRATALDRERRPLLGQSPTIARPRARIGVGRKRSRHGAPYRARYAPLHEKDHIRYLAPGVSSRERIIDKLATPGMLTSRVHGQYQPRDPRASRQLLLAGDKRHRQ